MIYTSGNRICMSMHRISTAAAVINREKVHVFSKMNQRRIFTRHKNIFPSNENTTHKQFSMDHTCQHAESAKDDLSQGSEP